MDELFSYLNYNGINKNNVYDAIFKLSNSKINMLLNGMQEIIHDNPRIENNKYIFSTNSEFNGSRNVCNYLGCRKERLSELSRFSVLFADTVLIENPLDIHIFIENFNEKNKFDLCEDIELLFWMRPFLDEKLFSLRVNNNHFCKECFEKVIISNPEINYSTLIELKDRTIDFLIDNVQCMLNKDLGTYTIKISGPEEIIDHGSIILIVKDEHIDYFSSFKNGYLFNKDEIKELEFVHSIVETVYSDLLNSNWESYEYNSKYVTNRDFEIKVLSDLNGNSINNMEMMKGLEHIVPQIMDIAFEDLINLRNNEFDSFKLYRDSIYDVSKNNFNQNINFKELFDDEIRPNLNKLECKINDYKKSIKRRVGTGLAMGLGLVTVGIVNGIIPESLYSQIISLGGLETIIGSGIKLSSDFNYKPETEDLYFLWKIKNSR